LNTLFTTQTTSRITRAIMDQPTTNNSLHVKRFVPFCHLIECTCYAYFYMDCTSTFGVIFMN
jgi:hypothetical protein